MVLKVAGGGGGGTAGAVNYLGTWNASTNNPTLSSGVGVKGGYYVVSTAGTTSLDGISLWSVGDWAVFNGTVWQKVNGGSTESFANIAVTSLTGYMYANGSNLVTASTTIPVANVTGAVANTTYVNAGGLLTGGGNLASNVTISLSNVAVANITGLGTMATQNANAVAITGGTINSVAHTNGTFANANITSVAATFPNSFLTNSAVTIGNTTISLGGSANSIGNLTLANVTITSGSIPSSNVTGLGTMATQNANAVAITGGNISVTNANAAYHVATGNISANVNAGVFAYGNLSYSDTGIVASYANTANSYVQLVMQNLSNGTAASTDISIVNDTGSAYVDMGITSSNFTGTGKFYSANAAYLYSGSTDLYLGTITNNAIHIVTNNSATDAVTINANSTVNITSNLTAAGFIASNGLIYNSSNVSANVTISTGQNAMSVGPMTIANGVTVTVSSGQRWVVL